MAITSSKPQTTRDRVLGLHTVTLPGETPSRAQIAYLDTPGVQDGTGPLRRYRLRADGQGRGQAFDRRR